MRGYPERDGDFLVREVPRNQVKDLDLSSTEASRRSVVVVEMLTTRAEDQLNKPGTGVDPMLTGVEHEERPAIAQMAGERRPQRLPWPLTDIQHRGDGLGQQAILEDRIRGRPTDAFPSLASAPDPGQGQKPRAADDLAQLPEFPRPPDEATEFDRQIMQRPHPWSQLH